MVREVGRPKVFWWQVLRVAFVLGWVAWAALTWWVSPREGTLDDARADLTAGRVTTYEWGRGWSDATGLFSPGRPQLESADTDGPVFLWNTGDGRQHYITVPGGVPADVVDPAAQPRSVTPEGESLAAALRVFHAHDGPEAWPVGTLISGLSLAGVILFLWALVSASAPPAGGTRWFWFWLVGTAPLGLGLLWWLTRERPWSSRAPVREKRFKWWAGIGFGFLATLVLSLVLWGLHSLLGDALVPRVS
ncbi:hypothetical protein GCM10022629_89190 [Amorphoplanes auranticolor]